MADPGESLKTKSAKKDKSADNALAVAILVATQPATSTPLTLNIFPAKEGPQKNDKQSSASDSTGDTPETGKITETPAPRRSGLPIAPRIQGEGHGTPDTQPDAERAPAVAANASDGSLSNIEPAFEAHLQPGEPLEPAGQRADAAESVSAASGAAKDNSPAVAQPPDDLQTAPQSDPHAIAAATSVPAVAQPSSSSSKHGDGSRQADRESPSEAVSNAPGSIGAVEAPARFDINAAPPAEAATVSTPAPSRSVIPASVEAAPAPEPQPALTAPAAHDIKLELNGGGQRVEVRLSERGGDIHVAVRTTDASLSGAMRQDLPALTAKLEQSGFRAEAWQPGAATGAERRAADVSAANSSPDSQEHPGQHSQQQQDNPQQQNPKNPN